MESTSSEWCEMEYDGTDTDGTVWNRCTVHDRLAVEGAYVCEGYEAPAYVEIETRRDLAGMPCTLDGRPAVISGVRTPFARVTVPPDGPSIEYAWATVARVIAQGGAFRS